MSARIKRTQKEIEDVLNQAGECVNSGQSKFWGMSYEEGLREMYYWLTEDEPEHAPMDD